MNEEQHHSTRMIATCFGCSVSRATGWKNPGGREKKKTAIWTGKTRPWVLELRRPKLMETEWALQDSNLWPLGVKTLPHVADLLEIQHFSQFASFQCTHGFHEFPRFTMASVANLLQENWPDWSHFGPDQRVEPTGPVRVRFGGKDLIGRFIQSQ